MKLTLVCALGRNREIGRAGELIWRISDDLKRFKQITMGHPIVMGRKTHESIGRALPERTNIVVTRQSDYVSEGCVVASSIDQALNFAGQSQGGEHVFVVGGGELYASLIGRADNLALTLIDERAPDADTWFPKFAATFVAVNEEGPFEDEDISYRFVNYTRAK